MTDLVTMAPAVTLPRVNLLPPEIAAATRFRRTQICMGLGLLTVLTGIGLGYVVFSGQVSTAQEELDASSRAVVGTQGQIATYANVPATFAAVSVAKSQLAASMGAEVRWSYRLNELSLTIPNDVWLTGMTATTVTATPAQPGMVVDPKTAAIATVGFQGAARTYTDVATWLDSLAAIRDADGKAVYGRVYLSNAAAAPVDNQPAVTFSSTADVLPSALSGRYSGPSSFPSSGSSASGSTAKAAS